MPTSVRGRYDSLHLLRRAPRRAQGRAQADGEDEGAREEHHAEEEEHVRHDVLAEFRMDLGPDNVVVSG